MRASSPYRAIFPPSTSRLGAFAELPLLRYPARLDVPPASNMANRQYDQTSGQIFRQWTLDQRRLRPSVQELGWSKLNKHRYGRDLDPRAKGPRSLLDMAASIVVRNFGHVTEQHLETIPLSLRRCIWEFLQER